MNQEILDARYTHDQIVRKYNWIAPIYDLFGVLMESKARQQALDIAAIQNGEKILEVAFRNRPQFCRDLEEESLWVG